MIKTNITNVKSQNFFEVTGLSILEGKYRLHEEISGGKSATSFTGKNIETGDDVFIKLCIFPRSELERARFKNEVRVLQDLDFLNKRMKKTPSYISDGEIFDGKILYLITEKIHGTLLAEWFKLNFSESPLKERLKIAYRVFGATEHFSAFWTHRDLHPGNIILLNEDIDMLSDHPNFKTIILDWGQAYSRLHFEYSESDDDEMVIIHNGIGKEITNSFYNLPPETFVDWENSGAEYNKYDSWAMGLLLYKLITGEDLFSFKNIGQYAAAQGNIEWEITRRLSNISSYATTEASILTALVSRLLRKNHVDRMFIQDARFALWFILVEDFLPTDTKLINRFLDKPSHFDEVSWRHFSTEPFDYF